MNNVLKKVNKYRLMQPPEERPENKIISIHGRIIQNEGIKNDTLKALEKNDQFYEGILRMNYELISENTRLRKKCNNVICTNNRLSKKLDKTEKRLEKYINWKKKRNSKLKKWYKKRKIAKLKSLKVQLNKIGGKNAKGNISDGKRVVNKSTNKK